MTKSTKTPGDSPEACVGCIEHPDQTSLPILYRQGVPFPFEFEISSNACYSLYYGPSGKGMFYSKDPVEEQ